MTRIPQALLGLALLALFATPAAAQSAGALSNPGGTTPPAQTASPAQTTPAQATPPAAATAGDDDVPTPPDGGAAPPDEFSDIDEGSGGGDAATEGERMRMLVVDAAVYGVDPVVGRVASARMRQTGEELGYQALTQEETVAAAQQLQMPYPPTPADLWRVSWVARVHRGAFARIWSHAGQYVIEISVASLDGAGPFFARGTAGADDFRETVDRLLRTAMPAPNVWNRAQETPPAATGPQTPVEELDDLDTPSETPTQTRTREPEPELRRWSLALQTEAAFGVSSEFFYNHLVGVRLDFRITRDILLGAYFAYGNLNARNGRADNIFFMLQFEDRIRISNDIDLTIPLRAAVGYLPFNGPVIRLSAGLNYAITPDWEIAADLIVPTFWILADGGTAVSLDVGLELQYRF
ncbi:MAG: hypothetical protein KC619_12095 [Myxococcales bacterium]|nr:hypothetical protein [Myxococcales bacterium]